MRYRRRRFNPWVGKIPWGRKWQLAPVFLPMKSHGQRSLVAICSPGGCRVWHDWSDLAVAGILFINVRKKLGLPRWPIDKESACQCRSHRRRRFNPWVGKIPCSRKWQPTPKFLPRKSHRQRNLWAIVYGVAKSQTRLNTCAGTLAHTHTHTHTCINLKVLQQMKTIKIH